MMHIEERVFGASSTGIESRLFTLTDGDFSVALTDFGASWVSAICPSKSGEKADLLLGFSTCQEYERSYHYFGATVGRYANRIGGAGFSIDGKRYELDKNNGQHCLHGGRMSWDKRIWHSQILDDGIMFSLSSPDGDCGFPGSMRVSVSYHLKEGHELLIEYEAQTEAPSPINMTNHAYFNLSGEGSGLILDHILSLKASRYLEIDESTLPSGRLLDVADSPLDFLKPKRVGSEIMKLPVSYDHCMVIDKREGEFLEFARLEDPESGRSLKVATDQPGVQLYSGAYLGPRRAKNGHAYPSLSGMCLETQDFPDAPNRPEFPQTILRPGMSYQRKTVYSFGW